MAYDIRPPEPAELEDLAAVLRRARLEDLIAVGSSMAEAEAMADYLARDCVMASPGSEYLVVRVAADKADGALAGAFVVSVIAAMRMAYCVEFWVTAERRGDAALADLLVRHLEDVGREHGVTRLECPMYLSGAHTSAFEAFERAGYETVTWVMSSRLDREQSTGTG